MQHDDQILKVSKGIRIVFGILSALPLGICVFGYLYSGILKHETSLGDWAATLLVSLALGLVFQASVRFHKLAIEGAGVRYRRGLFYKSHFLEWDKIQSVSIEVKFRSTDSPVLMKIVGSDHTIEIAIKWFSKTDLVRLVGVIREKTPEAHFDGAVERLAKGTLPSIARKIKNGSL